MIHHDRFRPSQAPLYGLALFISAQLLAWAPTPAQAQASPATCGDLRNAFGPFDYRQDRHVQPKNDNMSWAAKLNIVERAHFTPAVEQLIRGASTVQPGPDLDYTLRAFPNHHRALATVMRAWERQKNPQPAGLPRPAECYFERAVRFRPDDTSARLLYASFLIKAERRAEAGNQLAQVRRIAGENAFTRFNLGMVYADAGMFTEALEQAHLALSLGLPRQDLVERLRSAGHWRDPIEAATPPARPASETEPQGPDGPSQGQ